LKPGITFPAPTCPWRNWVIYYWSRSYWSEDLSCCYALSRVVELPCGILEALWSCWGEGCIVVCQVGGEVVAREALTTHWRS